MTNFKVIEIFLGLFIDFFLFVGSYISLEHINDDNCFMKLEEKDENYRSIKEIIQNLSVNKLNNKNNLTCTIERIYDKLKDSDQNSLTDTNLFSIIFLSSCAMLTFGLCIGWSLLVYYRRFKQYRIKKQQQKELECCVRRILDKSPIIIFNSKNKDEHFIDDDSVCAICLESFIDNEKLRKLCKIKLIFFFLFSMYFFFYRSSMFTLFSYYMY